MNTEIGYGKGKVVKNYLKSQHFTGNSNNELMKLLSGFESLLESWFQHFGDRNAPFI